MSEDKCEGEATAEMNLNGLPRKISDTHQSLCRAMKRLCVLEDFLFGSQVKESSPDKLKGVDSGILCKCFNGVDEINRSITEFHNQVESILSRLGAQRDDAPERM